MRGITLVHVQPLGHGHARDAMPADVIANACNARRWVGGGVGKMCSNLKYKKMVAINPEKIIFRALKKNFINICAIRFSLERKHFVILNTTVRVQYRRKGKLTTGTT